MRISVDVYICKGTKNLGDMQGETYRNVLISENFFYTPEKRIGTYSESGKSRTFAVQFQGKAGAKMACSSLIRYLYKLHMLLM